jgi:hypothetical protein
MRARQPLAEPPNGFVRGRPIEGHHRGRDTGCPTDIGAPASGLDGRDFDEVVTPANGFFEAMNECMQGLEAVVDMLLGTDEILRVDGRRSSEARYETRVDHPQKLFVQGVGPKTFFSLSKDPQEMHLSSTGFPQAKVHAVVVGLVLL